MQFKNSFEVSLPPAQAWPVLLDVEAIVPCMPGAQLLETIDERHFKGQISVRLGPVMLAFVCTAAFEEVDDAAHRATIKSQGADSKGRGGANATIQLHLEPSPKGSKVEIVTDLIMSGAVAQYGRGSGMIQSVANQIISQFSKNLEARIAQLKQADALPDETAAASPAAGAGAPAGQASGEPATGAAPAAPPPAAASGTATTGTPVAPSAATGGARRPAPGTAGPG
ncbi:SRPBCC family protein, partial [Pigmentiphaga soli]|uniref:SRPBCC family protein n=1 Tax=Pigmentiphaga soli TaxID=1007095 RepID=UPI0031EAA7C9